MADKYRERILVLERRRRHALRERKRALRRRRVALAKGHWADARSARRVARRKADVAQRARKNIDTLRAARKKHNAFIRWLRNHRKAEAGFQFFDGHKVCGWIAEDLKKARKSGLWKGYVISGFRTPEYSESLCRAMCGAPQCPGRCAGRATNHAKGPEYPDGAIDVTDSGGLIRAEQHLGLRTKHTLPRDWPHHSHTGQ